MKVKIDGYQPNLKVYRGDDLVVRVKGCKPAPEPVPVGTKVDGVYFDGYPQIVKKEGSRQTYSVREEKDVMVPMRDGVRLAMDIYRPDVKKGKFPALISFFGWQKELQAMTRWLRNIPLQEYYDSALWDGSIEAGDIDYYVTRGYIHIIPEPRNIGKSEGVGHRPSSMWPLPSDTYDLIEWASKQPWCNGNVGLTGACGFSNTQFEAAENPHPALKAITPFLNVYPEKHTYGYTGIFSCKMFNVLTGRHGNDSAPVPENTPVPPTMFKLPPEVLKRRLEEALNHPDIKYNSKWYTLLKYPMRSAVTFDALLESFHPTPPPPSKLPEITIPTYLSTSGIVPSHTWPTFESWENLGSKHKKLLLWPPMSPDRPQVQYSEDIVRWFDYWLKGIDTGILDEPPIKVFVNGVNKWRFEREWPLKGTEYVKFYLHPKGGLSTREAKGALEPDTFTQPAIYIDPTVYCLTYRTGPMESDLELTGYMALSLHASIDKEETNWMADLVDVAPEGTMTLITQGWLAAEHRELDKGKSRPYMPVHPRKDPIPVPPGEVIEYAIPLMPTSHVVKQGHAIQLIIRNQDDLRSRLGIWGVYHLPHLQTVTHSLHFGKSHVLLPVIPPRKR